MKYHNVSIMDYKDRFRAPGDDHVLVDVRSSMEYRNGHLPGAINIPLEQVQARTTEIPQGKPVVVVCASGNRSRTGANFISAAGYGEVYNLEGGTMTWMIGGNPIER